GPLGPEGLLAIPSRDLLVVSGEEDDPEFGVRSSVMIYKLKSGKPAYPQILSADDVSGKPIPWSALSGMVATGGRGDKLLAVWDSFYAQSAILTINASENPALIVDSLPITGGTGDYDPEGIDVAPDGTYWIASEGNADGSRPNRLLQVDKLGQVISEIGLPAQIESCRAASTATGSLGAGFEGVAVLSRSWSWSWHKRDRDYVLLVAQQRGWDYTTAECEDLDDDALGLKADGEPKATRIWIYDPKDGSWDHIGYELAEEPANAAWVGLSEITKVPGGYVVLERDNRTGDFAELKTLVNFGGRDAKDGFIEQAEKRVYDMLPDLLATNGWITDKPEGVAVTGDGSVYVVTDNDGVDDWSGETWFFRAGNLWKMFW
ncbi:MAG: esterase-like activity of phytase family protein, partial [Gammaproteobacteria bacterium]